MGPINCVNNFKNTLTLKLYLVNIIVTLRERN